MTSSATAPAAVPPKKAKIPVGLVAGFLALILVLLAPLPADLAPAGHRLLAILAFAVVVWISAAVPSEARATTITPPTAILLATAPAIKDPAVVYGTSA